MARSKLTDLTLVSLFSGVGGFDEAFRRAGVKTVAQVENDRWCQYVLRRHFPDATLFGDIKEVTGDDIRAAGFNPERGIVAGGSPCQDFSLAGRRAGLDGDRSGLFREYLRLLDELHPKWFVFENVPGLLSSNNGRDYGAVLGALGELGYHIAGRILDAQHAGVPQRRRRIILIGHLGTSWRAPAEILFESDRVPGYLAAGRKAGEETPGITGAGVESRGSTVTTHTHTR